MQPKVGSGPPPSFIIIDISEGGPLLVQPQIRSGPPLTFIIIKISEGRPLLASPKVGSGPPLSFIIINISEDGPAVFQTAVFKYVDLRFPPSTVRVLHCRVKTAAALPDRVVIG